MQKGDVFPSHVLQCVSPFVPLYMSFVIACPFVTTNDQIRHRPGAIMIRPHPLPFCFYYQHVESSGTED